MPLDPEIAKYLEAEKLLPPRSSLSIEATRERMRRANAFAGEPRTLARVEDLQLFDDVPARQYWPADNAALPVVLYFHGGRFISGDLESHDSLCRSLAAASGCRIVAVDYRLAPEHRFPAATDDAASAVAWATSQRVPVGIAGDSVGANLAAGAALGFPAQLRCQLLVYPMLDATCSRPSYQEFATGYGPGAEDMKRGWLEYIPEGTDPRDPVISPIFAEEIAGPPAMVITAEFDTLRDEGEAYAQKLKDAGIPVELRRYEGTIHGFFGMAGLFAAGRRALAESTAFLRRHLIER